MFGGWGRGLPGQGEDFARCIRSMELFTRLTRSARRRRAWIELEGGGFSRTRPTSRQGVRRGVTRQLWVEMQGFRITARAHGQTGRDVGGVVGGGGRQSARHSSRCLDESVRGVAGGTVDKSARVERKDGGFLAEGGDGERSRGSGQSSVQAMSSRGGRHQSAGIRKTGECVQGRARGGGRLQQGAGGTGGQEEWGHLRHFDRREAEWRVWVGGERGEEEAGGGGGGGMDRGKARGGEWAGREGGGSRAGERGKRGRDEGRRE